MSDRQFSPWSGERCAGVYALCEGDRILYIGQTHNVPRRVGSHRSRKRIQFNGVFVVPENDRRTRQAVERELIRKHKPAFNVYCIPKEESGPVGPLICTACGCSPASQLHDLCFRCRARAAYQRHAPLHESARIAFVKMLSAQG